MSKTAIISINALGRVLTPNQKEFNRLCNKIKALRQQVEETEEGTRQIFNRVQTEFRPLFEEFNGYRAQIVHLLDRHLDSAPFNAGQKKKMHYIIDDICNDLIPEGYDDLKPIFEKYNETSFDEIDAESDAQAAEIMKNMMENMFGIEFDPDADVSTPEKMQAYVQQKMAEEQAKDDARKAEREARRQAKPKTEKQLKAEAKRAAKEEKEREEASKITKSVREVYMDLVKAFHPDLEKDETEKARKTAIMQRVTAAYEANDLLELLNLQMELERIDQEHLETLAEDRLKIFNKVLREQARELQDQLEVMAMQLAAQLNPNMMMQRYNIHQANYLLNADIKSLRAGIKDLKQDLKILELPKGVKEWLKEFKIPKRKDGPDGFLDEIFGFW